MDTESEIRDFLTSRRARVRPEQVELPGGPGRRVPGLRRSEVALLAGVSVEYYTRLERGRLGGVSEVVLDSLATALLLDDAEREHLSDLARAANESPVRARRRRRPPETVSRSMQLVLDAVTAGPAFVRNGRMDVLAENALFRALYSDLYALDERPVNLARFVFLHREQAEAFYPSWSVAADINVAILRTEAGRDPHDRALHDLIGELSTRSDEFRVRWGAHEVRHHTSGQKRFHHPVVGQLDMVYEAMEPMGRPGLNFLVYSAEPGSPTEERLRLLASWAAPQADPAVVRADAPDRPDVASGPREAAGS
ncbi:MULTISPECIES: helix-turn-helix transcriptional regulator [unclassified Frigoribacterium]|uniref:helix-turn-helix transcriptional regulator n=1 Tax=unclassified Frigoribacterium TaxID=2627005 RepID=UPI001564A438|nr:MULTISPECIES: helix-turn-helix transcriptional regulator [unclassified Frigoribacterium]NQW87726.1 helix-turn-helix domain-containing protein [Frigoribacterium sp. VKM Ac-2860]NQX09465.1 helix-turn-helix domain-containing protein [Frigoribacterium sp. VKM Ac-2859]